MQNFLCLCVLFAATACAGISASPDKQLAPLVYVNAKGDFQNAMQGWQEGHNGFLFNYGTDGLLSDEIHAMYDGRIKLRQPKEYTVLCIKCADPVHCTVTADIRFTSEKQTSLREYQLVKTGFFGLYSETELKDRKHVRQKLAVCLRENDAMFTAFAKARYSQ